MEKPLLIYDGHCGFCKLWIEYFKRRTGDRIGYAPSQEVREQYPRISTEQFDSAVQLVFPDGSYISGAEAVFRTLQIPWIPGIRAVSELAYQLVAAHRTFFYQLTKLFFGTDIRPAGFERIEELFLKALGMIYLFAFASIGSQVLGLIGRNGVLPAVTFLAGSTSFLDVPTLFWFNASDRMLQAGWIAGCFFALLIFAGLLRRSALCAAWVLYLSFVSIGQDFFTFQWDLLLLEAGFLAISLGWSRSIDWLNRWLLFRLMFLSGTVKWLSGDPTWRSFTALEFHYQTQPLPTPVAWYAHQLPTWFQHLSAGCALGIEIFVPFLIFAPRRLRLLAIVPLAGLQILIFLTGNYAFFNLLALALCLFLLEDRDLRYVSMPRHVPRIGRRIAVAASLLIFTLSSYQLLRQFALIPAVRNPTEPFGIANNYGLFAVMTTMRPEILIAGSNDGSHWEDYEFRYKPGDLKRRPPWVAPHQPRLDWQMWFAALGSPHENPWIVNLLLRLLQGSPDVLDLLGRNPFPTAPPRYVRAFIYNYKFTDAKTRNETGAWWSRELLGTYVRLISLADVRSNEK